MSEVQTLNFRGPEVGATNSLRGFIEVCGGGGGCGVFSSLICLSVATILTRFQCDWGDPEPVFVLNLSLLFTAPTTCDVFRNLPRCKPPRLSPRVKFATVSSPTAPVYVLVSDYGSLVITVSQGWVLGAGPG